MAASVVALQGTSNWSLFGIDKSVRKSQQLATQVTLPTPTGTGRRYLHLISVYAGKGQISKYGVDRFGQPHPV